MSELERIQAVEATQDKYIEKHHKEELRVQLVETKLEVLEKKVEKIDGNILKAVWIIVGSTLAGVMGLVMGGFNGR